MAVWLGVPSSALASPLRRLDGNAIAFATDGDRYALWQFRSKSPLIVYDTRTGHRGEIDDGCALSGGAAAGRFMVDCSGPTLLDVRTGTLTRLPTGEGRPEWNAVGTRYVAGTPAPGVRCHGMRRHEGCTALYRIATGSVSVVRDAQYPNLDRPGAPPLCRRLRKKLLAETPPGANFSYSDGGLREAAEVFYDARARRVGIEGCHGRTVILRSGTEPRDLELGGGLLSWDTGHSTESAELQGRELGHATLSIYSVSSGRRRTWGLPRLPLTRYGNEPPEGERGVGVYGYSTHTSNTVFWIANRSLSCEKGCDSSDVPTYYIYAARL